jgi:hypothetical protein
METSQEIGLLAEALAKAQGAFSTAAKDAENPHLRNRFGSLDSLIRATRPSLAANGLAVIQAISLNDGRVAVTTTLAHASGQWVNAAVSAPVADQKGVNPLQAVGVVVSYLRRYSYGALVGVVASDDTDGESVEPRLEQPPAPATCNMSGDRFNALVPKWVESGKSADEIAAYCIQKGQPLTAGQQAELEDAIDNIPL